MSTPQTVGVELGAEPQVVPDAADGQPARALVLAPAHEQPQRLQHREHVADDEQRPEQPVHRRQREQVRRLPDGDERAHDEQDGEGVELVRLARAVAQQLALVDRAGHDLAQHEQAADEADPQRRRRHEIFDGQGASAAEGYRTTRARSSGCRSSRARRASPRRARASAAWCGRSRSARRAPSCASVDVLSAILPMPKSTARRTIGSRVDSFLISAGSAGLPMRASMNAAFSWCVSFGSVSSTVA